VQAFPEPYPQPPPKQGLSGLAIGLIVAGCLAVLGLGALFMIGVAVGFTREIARAGAAKADPLTIAFSESYATTNGLLTAHYPSDFAAKKLDDSTLLVSRNLGGGVDEVLTLAAVTSPITDDPHEFARILWASHDKGVEDRGWTTTKTGDRAAMCLQKYAGVEVEGTFTAGSGNVYLSKGCFFIRDNRGYEVRYDVSRTQSAEEVPLLERMIDATEIAP
jgi:hypothetical protein